MDIIERCKEYVKGILYNETSGHDYYHTLRVFNVAMTIQKIDGGDLEVIQLATLLHDVDDYKVFGDDAKSLPKANKFLLENNVDKEKILIINDIINTISFKAKDTQTPVSLEGKIVQDADMLDALGAIGIARTFAVGASRGRPLHDPNLPVMNNMSKEIYEKNVGTTINHFYEKLFHIKNLLNTSYARELANDRTKYMEDFLNRFYDEWDGLK